VAGTGGTPTYLATASTGGDSWPKWAPIVQAWQGRPILWFTFSSRRAYGLRIAAGAHAQVWMAAFDPSRASGGMDASLPAFWLPFQDPGSGNHIAQWVLNVDRMGCNNDSMCGTNEFCVGGHCYPRPM
jgi:TolB protein